MFRLTVLLSMISYAICTEAYEALASGTTVDKSSDIITRYRSNGGNESTSTNNGGNQSGRGCGYPTLEGVDIRVTRDDENEAYYG